MTDTLPVWHRRPHGRLVVKGVRIENLSCKALVHLLIHSFDKHFGVGARVCLTFLQNACLIRPSTKWWMLGRWIWGWLNLSVSELLLQTLLLLLLPAATLESRDPRCDKMKLGTCSCLRPCSPVSPARSPAGFLLSFLFLIHISELPMPQKNFSFQI